MVLNIVMSIMGGFEHELKERLLGTNAHIVVRSIHAKVSRWPEMVAELEKTPGVESVSPFTYHQALLRGQNSTSGILLKGIGAGSGSERELSRFVRDKETLSRFFESADSDVPGALPPILLGGELMRTMAVLPGSKVSLLSPNVQSSPFGLIPRYRRFAVIGRYNSGLVEYESSLAYTTLKAAQAFFRLGDSVTGLELRVNDVDRAPEIAKRVMTVVQSLEEGTYAQDWTESNRALWEALRLEKSAYFIVLLLLIVLASFSIISTLVMIVLEKKKDIAVLRTLGARSRDIGNIFRIQGAIIGAAGTLIGLFAGYIGCLALQRYGFPLPEKIFPVETLPVRMDLVSFLVVGVCSFLICCLATIYPAARASRLKPSEILRYE